MATEKAKAIRMSDDVHARFRKKAYDYRVKNRGKTQGDYLEYLLTLDVVNTDSVNSFEADDGEEVVL